MHNKYILCTKIIGRFLERERERERETDVIRSGPMKMPAKHQSQIYM
jgi:hypothetical protein